VGIAECVKVGKVLIVSHGMGNPSCSIFLHETAKLLWHAKVDFSKIRLIRLGTSGGLGVPAGTVVVASQAMDATLELGYELVSLGEKMRLPAVADRQLNDALLQSNSGLSYQVTEGITIATDDYYEGQGRLDGAFETWYSESDKCCFLQKANSKGAINMEMEATVFLAFFQRLNLPATVVCATLLDRLKGDQHVEGPEKIKEYSARPQDVAINYLRSCGLV